MKQKYISLLAVCIASIVSALFLSMPLAADEIENPDKHPDGFETKKTLMLLFNTCHKIDALDPKVSEMGPHYKVAPLIIYRGKNKKRKWKDALDYADEKEKMIVDGICTWLNSTINKDPKFKFGKFFIKNESGQTWYVWEIFFTKRNEIRKVNFAFIKVDDRYILADIN